MGPKAFLVLVVVLAVVLLISSEVAARGLVEETREANIENGETEDQKYPGGYGGYPGGGYPGGGYPGRGYPGRGGGYCRWGCCRHGYGYRGGCLCCMHPGQVPSADRQAEPQH